MKSLCTRIALISLCLFLLSCYSHAETYEPTWESLKKLPVPQWFEDAKFGIFIHWGPYSVTGINGNGTPNYAEQNPQWMYRLPDKFYPLLKEKFGAHPPEFGYKDVIPLFKAEKFDANEWAALFAKAGARYVIPVGEHHDGFAMWDSALTKWDAKDMGPKRDIIGELEKAVRMKGMKFGVSTHRERHWWYYAKERRTGGEPHDDIQKEIEAFPECEELYGPFACTDEFMIDYVRRWEEITDKYRPDFMWIDDIAGTPESNAVFDKYMPGMIADYVNKSQAWGKEVYLNNKGKNLNWPLGIGCRSGDNLKLDSVGAKWENPATMAKSYGYSFSEDEADAYRSPAELIDLLVDVVSKNGTLLLNVGPKADGTIPEKQKQRLLAIGEWLKVNGEAIYGTRPWKVFGQESADSPKLRFTTKPNTLYAFCMSGPPQASFIIESAQGLTASDIKSLALLETGQALNWEMTARGLKVDVPSLDDLPAETAWVVKVSFAMDSHK